MNTQNGLLIISIFNLVPVTPVHLDENFYQDEAQLAAELAAPLRKSQDQPLPDVEADEFETLYNWFLS